MYVVLIQKYKMQQNYVLGIFRIALQALRRLEACGGPKVKMHVFLNFKNERLAPYRTNLKITRVPSFEQIAKTPNTLNPRNLIFGGIKA